MNCYLVGIKGSGMSSLAKILDALNENIVGCDYNKEYYTDEGLERIKIFDIDKAILMEDYIYIIGNAFLKHSIFERIKKNNLKYYLYPDFISMYFKKYYWISICGTHGKTQTTKLLCHILDNCVGLIGDGSFKISEDNKYFVIESCEYQNTFLHYRPNITLILNIDYDHVDFFKTPQEYKESFIKFINQSEIVIMKSEEKIKSKNIIEYSIADYNYHDGKVIIDNELFVLPLKGKKFAENFIGVYLVLKRLNISNETIKEKLLTYKNAKRRYEKKEYKTQVLLLDYAHHPKEIETIFETLKEEYPSKEIICIFEPHTLSRLKMFLADYKKVLDKFNKTYLYTFFSSVREKYEQNQVKYCYDKLNFELFDESIKCELKKRQNVVIAFLGAGIIDKEFENYFIN